MERRQDTDVTETAKLVLYQQNPSIPTTVLFNSQSLSGHQSAVESVTFDKEEEMVAAGAASGSIKIFDLSSAKGLFKVSSCSVRPMTSDFNRAQARMMDVT